MKNRMKLTRVVALSSLLLVVSVWNAVGQKKGTTSQKKATEKIESKAAAVAPTKSVAPRPDTNSNKEVTLVKRYLPENLLIKRCLEEPKILPVQALNGRVTILLFFASWHEESVKELARLDALVANKTKTVQLFAVTNEPERTAKVFNEKAKLKAAKVVVDDELSTLTKIFQHNVLPHAVVINPSLRIDAITDPKNIIEATIDLSYVEQDLDLKEKKDSNLDATPILEVLKKEEAQVAKMDFSPFNPAFMLRCMIPGQGQAEGRRLTYINMGTKEIFMDLYGVDAARVLVEAKDPSEYEVGDRDWDRLHCLDVIVPQGAGRQLKDATIKYLDYIQPLKSKIERRKVKVLLLKKLPKAKFTLSAVNQPSAPLSNDAEKLVSASANFTELADYLEKNSVYNKPILDETGIVGNHKIELKFPKDKENPLELALKEVGLQLESAERELDVLVLKEQK